MWHGPDPDQAAIIIAGAIDESYHVDYVGGYGERHCNTNILRKYKQFIAHPHIYAKAWNMQTCVWGA